jgi:hypothetical protein
VPNLPLVSIDHYTTDVITEVTTTETKTVVVEPAAQMSIVAQGEDQVDEDGKITRAIGKIEATYDIYANVLIEASRGGIGSIIASNDLGAVGSTETIEIKARTAIDTIYAGHNLGRPGVPIEIDVMGSGPGDTLPIEIDSQGNVIVDMEGTWLETNGVGVKGGIIAGSGDIYMNINTGGSIGAIEARTGKVVGEYHATGNLESVFGSRGVDGDFVAELGSTEYVLAMAGDIKGNFTTGGDLTSVHSTGDIIADFSVGGKLTQISTTKAHGKIEGDIVAVEGIGVVSAPFGNVSGSIYTGGNIGEIVEDMNAAKGDIDISLKLVNGSTSYISALNTTFALSDIDETANPYAYIRTNDQFTGIGTIQIKGSTSTTDFAITTDGGLFELDKFLVTGNFGGLADAAGGGADASIDTVKISGSVSGSFAVDGVIGSISVGGFGGEGGSIATGVVSGHTFTYTVGGATDTVSVVGANWRVSLDASNEIDASLTKILAQHLSFTTTSSVKDLTGDLSGRDLSLNIGGDLSGTLKLIGAVNGEIGGKLSGTWDTSSGDVVLAIAGDITATGKVLLHSGCLILSADDMLAGSSVAVTAGCVETLTLGGKMAGTITSDALCDCTDLMVFTIAGNMSGVINVLGNLDLNIGGNYSGQVTVGSGIVDLSVAGGILAGANITGAVGDLAVGGDIDPTLLKHYKLDTDTKTIVDVNGNYDDHLHVGSQTVSIVGSSTTLLADVSVAFGRLVLDTKVTGKGTFKFTSDGSVRDIYVGAGDTVKFNGISIEGSARDITTAYQSCAPCGEKSSIQNVYVSGSVRDITSGKLVKGVQAKSIRDVKALFGDVMSVNVDEDIEKICALKSVQKITACDGPIGDIFAGTDIKIIRSGGGLNSAMAGKNISDVIVGGDINLLDGGTSVKKIRAFGNLGIVKSVGNISDVNAAGDLEKMISGGNISKVVVGGEIKLLSAAKNVTYVSAGDGGEVYAGGSAKHNSLNLVIHAGILPPTL